MLLCFKQTVNKTALAGRNSVGGDSKSNGMARIADDSVDCAGNDNERKQFCWQW